MPLPKTITIFLASSNELQDERDKFRLFIAGLNDKLVDRHVYLKVIHWEKFLDAISETGLQDEYNKELAEVDIALCLFFTKVGKYSEEEFNTAYKAFKASGKPKIWTYFKNAPIDSGTITKEINTLLLFKERLKEYGHYFTEYENTADLHNKFRHQLDIIIPELLLPLRKKKKTVPAGGGNELVPALKTVEDIPQNSKTTAEQDRQKSIDKIDFLLEEPTPENIKAVIDILGTLTKNTGSANFILPLRADFRQFQQDKLSGYNMNGRLNVLLVRIMEIISDYKQSIK